MLTYVRILSSAITLTLAIFNRQQFSPLAIVSNCIYPAKTSMSACALQWISCMREQAVLWTKSLFAKTFSCLQVCCLSIVYCSIFLRSDGSNMFNDCRRGCDLAFVESLCGTRFADRGRGTNSGASEALLRARQW